MFTNAFRDPSPRLAEESLGVPLLAPGCMSSDPLLDPIRQPVARVFRRPAAQDALWAISLRLQRR